MPDHPWRFFRAGGFQQVRLETGDDIAALDGLDQKLWVALACPVSGLEMDRRTLEVIDADGDGRIRPPEVIEATRWARRMLRDPSGLLAGSAQVRLDAIDDSHGEGRALLGAMRRSLALLGRPGADAISVEDVVAMREAFDAGPLNGDGIVPPESADDPDVRAVIADAVACRGGNTDRSGRAGASREDVAALYEAAAGYAALWDRAEADPSVLPLGDGTSAAHAAWRAVAPKVDDFFTRCRLAEFDPRAAGILNGAEAEYAAMAQGELRPGAPAIAAFPIAHVRAGARLPLSEGINPAWADRVEALARDCVRPILGERKELDASDWRDLSARLAPYAAWAAEADASPVASLGRERARALRDGPWRDAVLALIDADLALAPEAQAMASVERLVRLHRDLFRLLKNFVSFQDFYGRREKAIFQAGTLFIDRRACELCIEVVDPARHAALASHARTWLAYCDLTRKATGEKKQIVAAVTAGGAEDLVVGRNGVFYDREGRDWDAVLVRIVDNPTSIGAAFWAPYRKVGQMISQQIEKFAAARASDVEAGASKRVADASTRVEGKEAPKSESFDIARFAGIFAAIGLALGAIGGAISAMLVAFTSLAFWQMPLALAGIVLAISGPSMLLAALKLRGRNLGPLLDANGWALNARAMVNIPFGGSLTQLAALPPGARVDLDDPYAPPGSGRRLVVLASLLAGALALAWYTGSLERLFGLLAPG
ncbi:hypothetical protein L6R50_25005 [Myxococcota bacterium]|nr:hypothetical protein [Myxococcota bacterium]